MSAGWRPSLPLQMTKPSSVAKFAFDKCKTVTFNMSMHIKGHLRIFDLHAKIKSVRHAAILRRL